MSDFEKLHVQNILTKILVAGLSDENSLSNSPSRKHGWGQCLLCIKVNLGRTESSEILERDLH